MGLPGPRQPPARVWVLGNVTRLDPLPVRREGQFLEDRHISNQGDAGAAGGGVRTADGDGRGVARRMQHVLAVAGYRHEEQGQRSVLMTAAGAGLQRRRQAEQRLSCLPAVVFLE